MLDYDGDQVTTKVLWTQEANKEAEELMNKKSFLFDSNGRNVRSIDIEAIQTFYSLTKNPIL